MAQSFQQDTSEKSMSHALEEQIARVNYTTIKLRLSDKHSAILRRQARAVNFVWNYCNETQMKAAKSGRRWLTGYDLGKLCAGSSKMLRLNANTIDAICQQYERSRRQNRKRWLRFRGRKSLGWIPFKGTTIQKRNGTYIFYGVAYGVLHDRPETDAAKFRAGSFNCDARGRWYVNLIVEARTAESAPISPVGIDLGLKKIAALSTGRLFENPKHLYRLANKLSNAHRAGKKRLAASVYAKIKNSRSDFLHKLSHQIASSHNLIVVGNVSSTKLAKTRFAKSVLDAGWATLRHQLSYKAIRHNGIYAEVNESMTSQTCSECGSISGPKGLKGLGVRQFDCLGCGASLNRDVNAARNILARFSQEAPVEGAAKVAELTIRLPEAKRSPQ
jgi:putative transposase